MPTLPKLARHDWTAEQLAAKAAAAHKASHATGGTDALTAGDIGAATAAQGALAASASQPGHTHTLDDTTDTATRLALTPDERTKLTNTSGTNTGDQTLPTWTTLSGKPAVIAAGATQADARTAIGALDGTLHAIGNASDVITVNPTAGGTQTVTLTGASTIKLDAGTPGASITLILTQGAGAPHAVAWDHRISWPSAPVASTAAGLVDVFTFVNLTGWGWFGFVAGTGLTAPIDAIVDTFTRANSATLGTTESGQAWISTNWTVDGGSAVPTVKDITTRALVDTGRSDRIRVSVRLSSALQIIRLGARVTLDGATYFRLVRSGSPGTTGDYFQRNNGGGVVQVGDKFELGILANERLGFSVTMSGGVATLSAYRGETLVYSTTDSAPPPAANYAGMIGLSLHAVDDFRVDYL